MEGKMKSFKFPLLGLALILFTFPHLSLGQYNYTRVFGGEGNQRAYALSWGVVPGSNILEYVLAGCTESYIDTASHPLIIGVKQYGGTFLWGLTTRDSGVYGRFNSIAKAEDGFVLAGSLLKPGLRTGYDIMTAKVSMDGQYLGGVIYPLVDHDFAYSITPTRDSGFAVCGWTYSCGPDPKPNIIVLKVSRRGYFKWARVYWFLPHLGADRAYSITELPFYANHPELRYAVVGATNNSDNFWLDAFVMTLDSLGNPIWAKVIPGNASNSEEAVSVVVSHDTLTAAGWTSSTSGTGDIFLLSMRAYDGQTLWKKTYGHPDFSEMVVDDRCLTLNPAPSVNHPYRFLVSGITEHTPASEGKDFQYLAVKSNGYLLWARRHPSLAGGYPYKEVATQSLIYGSDIAIAGYSANSAFTNGEDMHLLCTHLNGLNHICTARDTIMQSGLPSVIFSVTCSSRVVETSNAASFSMDTITVPGRGTCFQPPFRKFEKIDLPSSVFLKPVKSGGGLVALGNNLYLLVGNNTRDFGRYNLEDGVWSKEESVPLGVRNKKVKKGACMIAIPGSDGKGVEGEIYLLKGGGTNEFYKFTPNGKGWQTLPEPGFMKGVKGGFMAAVAVNDCTYIYAGSGYKNEWKRFNLQTGQWEKCLPETLPGGNWKIGSSMDGFLDGVKKGNLPNKLILMQAGGRGNNIFMFNPQPEPPGFLRLANLPLVGRSARKKKVGEGASIRMFNPQPEPPGEGKGPEPTPWFLATKGKNTKEFWQLEISSAEDDTGHWTQLPDIPSEKGIKGGGSLTYSPWDLGIYLTVGNNTNEIFAYYPSQEESLFSFFPKEPSSMGKADKASHRVRISNPARGLATIYYNLPKKEKVALKIYNMLGDIVYSEKTDRGFFSIKKLPAGIYLLRFESKDYKEERKLILVK